MVVVETATKPSRFAHSWQGTDSLAPARQNNIWTSPSVFHTTFVWTFVTFVTCHFVFHMCFPGFPPRWRPPYQHLNFQKRSQNAVLCSFWFPHVLRAKAARAFFDMSTSKSGPTLVCFVHFGWFGNMLPPAAAFNLSSHLARWLRTRRFSFSTCGVRNHRKTYTFLPVRALGFSFFWLSLLWASVFFSSLLFCSLLYLFQSLPFICPYCRKLDVY